MGFSADIQRHFDAHRLNEIANHPDVRPTCGGDGKSVLDFTSFISDPRNYAFVWGHGAIMFHWSEPGTYEVHVMVLPEGRGSEAYHATRKAVDTMLGLGSERLLARVAKGYRALKHFASCAGFSKCGISVLDIGFGPVTYDIYQREQRCLQQ